MRRRTFLQGAAFAGASSLVLTPMAASANAAAIQLEHVELVLPNLPAPFDGYRIGFMTDTHLSRVVPHAWISEAASLLSASSPDLLLLGGDYHWVPDSTIGRIWGAFRNERFPILEGRALARKIFDDMADLLQPAIARDGAFGVLGNHDRWYDPDYCIRVFRAKGIPILVNAARSIQRGEAHLHIVGVDDYWNGVPQMPDSNSTSASMSDSKNSAKKNALTVLLSHNPDYVAERLRQAEPGFDLALCGHTHGGQMIVPALNLGFFNVQDERFRSGLAQVGDRFVYTSRGIGMVELPFRLNCPPEVTVLTLRRG